MSWSEGYNTQVSYTHSYFNNLNPANLDLLCVLNQIQPPKIANVCELGIGNGVSFAYHASLFPDIGFYGTDFMPNQVLNTKKLLKYTKHNANVYDESFALFCDRDDLPKFDFIALHGIWTWVNEENRCRIVDFINNRLNPGGVVYVSYNVKAGWHGYDIVRDLLKRFVDTHLPVVMDPKDKIEKALNFLDEFFKTNPKIITDTPGIKSHFESLRKKPVEYLVHEYLNDNFHLVDFSEIDKQLAGAKLTFLGPCDIFTYVPVMRHSNVQNEFIDKHSDPAIREILSDLSNGNMFRTDLWVKGSNPLSVVSQVELFKRFEINVVSNLDKFPKALKSPSGTLALKMENYFPVFEVLKKRPVITVADLESILKDQLSFEALKQVLLVISANNFISLRLNEDEESINEVVVDNAASLNRAIFEGVGKPGYPNFLICPKARRVISIAPLDRLFLKAYLKGATSAAKLVVEIENELDKLKLSIDNPAKENGSDETVSEALKNNAVAFLTDRLPLFKSLNVM